VPAAPHGQPLRTGSSQSWRFALAAPLLARPATAGSARRCPACGWRLCAARRSTATSFAYRQSRSSSHWKSRTHAYRQSRSFAFWRSPGRSAARSAHASTTRCSRGPKPSLFSSSYRPWSARRRANSSLRPASRSSSVRRASRFPPARSARSGRHASRASSGQNALAGRAR
jgi:hypothetical protein